MPGSRLSLVEREEIALGVARGESLGVIAGRIGRYASTVSRELARNSNRRGSTGRWGRSGRRLGVPGVPSGVGWMIRVCGDGYGGCSGRNIPR